MWNNKIAMATFSTCCAKMVAKFKKENEWRCQGIKRRFRKPKHSKEHIKRDSIKYFLENAEWM